MRVDDALFGEYFESLYQRFGADWEDLTPIDEKAPLPLLSILPGQMCDDCLMGCHKHCGDPTTFGQGPCECTDPIHA